jgi:hypothetical protein
MMQNGKESVPEACPVLPSADGNRAAQTGPSISTHGTETHIDVRGLESPMPLVSILTLLESPDVSDTVIVIHDRDPLLLYPELEERGWTWSQLPAPMGQLHLRLTRTPRVED